MVLELSDIHFRSSVVNVHILMQLCSTIIDPVVPISKTLGNEFSALNIHVHMN